MNVLVISAQHPLRVVQTIVMEMVYVPFCRSILEINWMNASWVIHGVVQFAHVGLGIKVVHVTRLLGLFSPIRS